LEDEKMQIKITNKIEQKIEEYRSKTGASKKWISEQLNMSSQNLFACFKVTNPTIETLIRFSLFLKCDIKDLFEYEIIED
jgi:DNA-binding XRE family transcriptional regulator